MRIKRERGKALAKVGVPTHQSKDAPSVGKLGRVMSLRIFPRPNISFDYSVSTLTRTFRIKKKKQNYFCALVDARTRVVRVVFEDRVSPRDGLDEIEKYFPLTIAMLENYEFIKKKTNALIKVSSWFFFLLFLRTNFMPLTRPSFVNNKDFSAEWSLLSVLLIHLYENYRANDE